MARPEQRDSHSSQTRASLGPVVVSMAKFTHHIDFIPLGSSLIASVLSLSCGKPATAEDCERIVTRITELELKEANISEPGNVAQQIEETKQRFSETAQRDCIGRRISKRSLDCVESATSAKQIVEECFD